MLRESLQIMILTADFLSIHHWYCQATRRTMRQIWFALFMKRHYNGRTRLPHIISRSIEGDDRMSEDVKIQDGQVVSMDYSLTVDGKIVDSSDGHGPLEFIQGTGNIIPGLERELYGLVIGDNKKVTVAPPDAYGELDQEAYVEVPRAEFPDN